MLWDRLAPRTLLLCYHRIAEVRSDRFQLCVSPQHFAEHLRVLQECDLAMPFETLADFLQTRRLRRRRAVVITFDDGYADNLHAAAPLLAAQGMHAMFYICTGWIERAREAWWDTLETTVRDAEMLPDRLRFPGIDREFETAERTALLESAYPYFRDALPPQREDMITALRATTGAPEQLRSSRRPLTRGELRKLAALPGVHIGAHTVEHPYLPSLPESAQENEIALSRAWLQSELGRPVLDFSYPYGAFTEETRAAAARAGAATAVTCHGSATGPGGDLLTIPRVVVHDWEGADFARRLQWWFTH